jgi:L-fucose isomerase-like protein
MNTPRTVVKIAFAPTYRFEYSAWCGKMHEESLAALKTMEGVEIVCFSSANQAPDELKSGAFNSLAAADAAAEYFISRNVDGLILCPLDFGDERSAAKIAERLAVPVLLCATKEPAARSDASLSRISDSYCGNLSIASALYRRKIPFHYAGLFFPHEPGYIAQIEIFIRAVAVIKGLTRARIGQIGVRPEQFESVTYNESALMQKFGQNIICREISDVVSRAQALEDTDALVQKAVNGLRQSVASATVSENYLLCAAKLELAISEFWKQEHLSALAVQCWPALQQLVHIEPCAVLGRLTEKGMLAACEADVIGALSMLVNYQAALNRTLPHFIDWTIRHREHNNRLLAWHCGNAPVCLAADRQKTALRTRANMKGGPSAIQGDQAGGLYQFQLKPGPVTFCRLAEYDGSWKMLIAAGTIIPSNETLAGTWSWVEVSDHETLYRTLVEEGFIHHASMIHGVQKQSLMLACKFMDIAAIVVD